MNSPKHPMQPILFDEHGVARFKRNAIVEFLLENTDLNTLSSLTRNGKFPVEDYDQLMQLIGYSVSGYGDLNWSSVDTVKTADQEVDRMIFERDHATVKS